MDSTSVNVHIAAGHFVAALHELQQKGVIPPATYEWDQGDPLFRCRLITAAATFVSKWHSTKREAQENAARLLIEHHAPPAPEARIQALEAAVSQLSRRINALEQACFNDGVPK